MAIGYTNFREYATGTQPSDWTLVSITGTVIAKVESLAGSVSGRALQFTESGGGAEKSGYLTWDGPGTFADGEVLCLLRMSANNGSRVGPCAREQGNDQGEGVGASIDGGNGGEVIVARGTTSTSNVPNSTGLAPTIGGTNIGALVAGTRYWLRLNFDGSSYKIKYWEAGTDEPAAWLDEDSDANPPTTAGGVGLSVEIQTGETIVFEAFSWSDDPAVSAPLYDFDKHDASTESGGSSTYNHTRGDLTNGVAVLRRFSPGANLGNLADADPTYDGNVMTLAFRSQRCDIYYHLLGTVSAGTHAVDAKIDDSVLSTYTGVDQDDPVRDTAAWGDNSGDYPDPGQMGAPVDSSVQGDVVVDAATVEDGTLEEANPENKAVRTEGGTAPQAFIAGDTLSINAATNMYYDYTVTGAGVERVAVVSFRAALPTFNPTFNLPSEHLGTLSSSLFLPSEHLLEIIEEVLNRKRLWVDLGADVRSIEVEI